MKSDVFFKSRLVGVAAVAACGLAMPAYAAQRVMLVEGFTTFDC